MSGQQFAHRFADKLFGTFPEWRQFVKSCDRCIFKVEVPFSYQKGPDDFLWILIEIENEIMVGADRFHTHEHLLEHETEEELFQAVITFLTSIVEEKVVFAIIMNGNNWAGSRIILANTVPFRSPGEHITANYRHCLCHSICSMGKSSEANAAPIPTGRQRR